MKGGHKNHNKKTKTFIEEGKDKWANHQTKHRKLRPKLENQAGFQPESSYPAKVTLRRKRILQSKSTYNVKYSRGNQKINTDGEKWYSM